MKLRGSKGFTLIEMIIVVAILGLIAAIAIPSYSSYRQRAGRATARAALVDAAYNLQKFFTRNHTYVGATVAAGGTVEPRTPHGLFQLSFQAGPTQDTYTLQAVAQSGQAGDTACAVMTINHLGTKLPAACW